VSLPDHFAIFIKLLTEDKLEDIVINEPLALGILHQLEGLRVVHRTLLLVDLYDTLR
jgi:hypothetical protein